MVDAASPLMEAQRSSWVQLFSGLQSSLVHYNVGHGHSLPDADEVVQVADNANSVMPVVAQRTEY